MNDVKGVLTEDFENHLKTIIIKYNELKESFLITTQLVSSDLRALDLILSFLVNYTEIKKSEFLELLNNFKTCLNYLKNDASLSANSILKELIYYVTSFEKKCLYRFNTIFNWFHFSSPISFNPFHPDWITCLHLSVDT